MTQPTDPTQVEHFLLQHVPRCDECSAILLPASFEYAFVPFPGPDERDVDITVRCNVCDETFPCSLVVYGLVWYAWGISSAASETRSMIAAIRYDYESAIEEITTLKTRLVISETSDTYRSDDKRTGAN